MEYSDFGSLDQLIKRYSQINKLFNEEDLWKILIQIMRGIEVLHRHKVMHRDLKSGNILIFKDNRVKIGDLNVSKYLKNNSKTVYTLCYSEVGAPSYCS